MLIGLLEGTASFTTTTSIPKHHVYRVNLGVELANALFNEGKQEDNVALQSDAELIYGRLRKMLSAHGSSSELALSEVVLNLGSMYMLQSRYTEAIKTFKDCLRLKRRLHKEHGILRVKVLIAKALVLDGQLEEAERQCSIVLSKMRQRYDTACADDGSRHCR